MSLRKEANNYVRGYLVRRFGNQVSCVSQPLNGLAGTTRRKNMECSICKEPVVTGSQDNLCPMCVRNSARVPNYSIRMQEIAKLEAKHTYLLKEAAENEACGFNGAKYDYLRRANDVANQAFKLSMGIIEDSL
jgi:hypothetical protein